jgi:hypothetical protein
MAARSPCRPALLGFALGLLGLLSPASAQDADLCFMTAERVEAGEEITAAEKQDAHEACLRALSDTASVVQKYQFQEADFAIMGVHPKF